jgi:hypothetical protein
MSASASSKKSNKSQKSTETDKSKKTSKIKPIKKGSLKLSSIDKIEGLESKDIDIDTFISDILYTEFPTSVCTYATDIKEMEKYSVKYSYPINRSLNHPENLYVIVGKHIYIGFDDIPPKFWHIASTLKQFKNILSTYNCNVYKDRLSFKRRLRVYIGNKDILNIGFSGFHRYLMLNNYCERVLWNSDDTYPYKKNLHKMSTLDIVSTLNNAIDDSITEINVYSKYSKSLIKIESHGGHYIADISYDPIDGSQNDLPADVISLFVNFPFMKIEDILNMSTLTPVQIDICVLLLNNIDGINMLSDKLNKVMDTAVDQDLIKYILGVQKRLDIDKQFNQLEKDGVFKAFENSLDILMKTVYEHCFNTDVSDDTRFYIDELLKHKFNSIIGNRMMV